MVGGFFLVFLFEKEGGGHFLETSCCGLKRNGVDGSRAHSVSKGRRIKKKKKRDEEEEEPFSLSWGCTTRG